MKKQIEIYKSSLQENTYFAKIKGEWIKLKERYNSDTGKHELYFLDYSCKKTESNNRLKINPIYQKGIDFNQSYKCYLDQENLSTKNCDSNPVALSGDEIAL